MIRRKLGVGIVALAGAIVLLLGGCASVDLEAPEAGVLPTETEVVAESQDTEQIEDDAAGQTVEDSTQETAVSKEPLKIPGCDAMNPNLQWWHEESAPKYPAMDPIGQVGLEQFEMYAGPTAQEAMNNAIQYRGCYYPLHLELAAFEWIAELPAPDQARLVDALSSDPSITSYVFGDALAFQYRVVLEYGVRDEIQITYVFVGDAWITVFDGLPAGELGISDLEDLLEPILEANPTLEVSLGL